MGTEGRGRKEREGREGREGRGAFHHLLLSNLTSGTTKYPSILFCVQNIGAHVCFLKPDKGRCWQTIHFAVDGSLQVLEWCLAPAISQSLQQVHVATGTDVKNNGTLQFDDTDDRDRQPISTIGNTVGLLAANLSSDHTQSAIKTLCSA